VFWYLLSLAAAFGLARGITVRLRESRANWARSNALDQRDRLRSDELDERERLRSAEFDERARLRSAVLDQRERFLVARDDAFRKGFLVGRQWLAEAIAEAEHAQDESTEEFLRRKLRPAPAAATIVHDIRAAKRTLRTRQVFLEYQLKTYEEYFPLLEEFRDVILDERIPLNSDVDNLASLEAADPILTYLSPEEYRALSSADRSQRALERYVQRSKSDWEIGRAYERYVGYLRERSGWRVTYHGALMGYADLGRDLVCIRDVTVEIIQAKCWSRSKVIHEKHLFQLFGTCTHYTLENPFTTVLPVLATTTNLSAAARLVAAALNIRVEQISLTFDYPLIKCNINPSTMERIYHLPFDQQYDRAVIGTVPGECYVATAQEAEAKGFRRAYRYHGG
jgi:hypothetical protein